ncbi:MAG: hypothetical protein ACRC1M_03220, partial [Methanobacteriaceae archaeon]
YNNSKNNTNLIISRNVTIYGAKYYYNKKNLGDTIIDGQKVNRFFEISPNVTVNIYGINFINGNQKNNIINNSNNSNITANLSISIIGKGFDSLGYGAPGGAIYNKGTLRITNCKFENNTASNTGGAIYNSGNCIILNSSFINNTALAKYISNVIVMCGGTIYVYEGNGGAMANNGGNLTIKFSNFSYNNAIVGSDIYNINNSNLNIESSGFYYSSSDTGAIFNCKSSTLVINKSKLLGLQKDNKKIIFTEGKSIITNNNISSAYYGIFNSGTADIEKNNINNCFIAIQNNGKNVKINQNTLTNNSQAIYNIGSLVNISKNSIVNASIGIFNKGSYVIINKNIIKLNKIYVLKTKRISHSKNGRPIYVNRISYVSGIVNYGKNVTIEENKISAKKAKYFSFKGIINDEKNVKIINNRLNSLNIGINNLNSSLIKNNSLSNCNTGIYNNGVSAVIKFNKIYNCIIAINNEKSKASINNNYIEGKGKYGIYNTGTKTSINNNIVNVKVIDNEKGKDNSTINKTNTNLTINMIPDGYHRFTVDPGYYEYGIYNNGTKTVIKSNTLMSYGKYAIYNDINSLIIKNNNILDVQSPYGDPCVQPHISYRYGIYNAKNNVSISNNNIKSKLGVYNEGNSVKIANNTINSFSAIYNKGKYANITKNRLNYEYPLMYLKSTLNYGIINSGNNVKIGNNTVEDYYYGVYNIGDNTKINTNVINGKKEGFGIYISKKSKMNVFYKNKISKFKYGIFLNQAKPINYNFNNNKIIKNKIIENKIGLASIYKFKNKKNVFKGNKKNIINPKKGR